MSLWLQNNRQSILEEFKCVTVLGLNDSEKAKFYVTAVLKTAYIYYTLEEL